MNPGDRISTIKGIGAKTESHLARIGIYTVGDMAEHYPREYHAYDTPVSIENTEYDNRRQSGYRVIFSETPKLLKRGRTPIVSVMLHAGNASVQVVWYHSPYVRQQLKPGCTVILYGKITSKGSRRMLDHPDIYTEDQYALLQKSLQPVYGLTEGLTQNFFMKTMHSILDSGLLLPDPLPADIRRQYQLSEYNYALRQIHFPENEEACRMARKRLVFDEFLVFELSVKQLKKENHQIENHYQIQESAAVSQLIASLPYHLTKAQLRVWHEIEEDMKSPVVMNRLVQGDVGSGKTMIAALAMFAAAKAGFQSCMMAPTEVLARQHYENLQALYAPFGIETVLLTGSMTAAAKRKTYSRIENHEADVIIGTQALFQEKAVYEQILATPEEPVSGTVTELAQKYNMELTYFVGFLDGINDSLKNPNPIEEMEADTVVSLDYDKEKLYYNMVAAKADWLYGLEQWDALLTPERRKELYKEQRSSTTVVKPPKIGRNDPCPCGSGKKYKKCCGRN